MDLDALVATFDLRERIVVPVCLDSRRRAIGNHVGLKSGEQGLALVVRAVVGLRRLILDAEDELQFPGVLAPGTQQRVGGEGRSRIFAPTERLSGVPQAGDVLPEDRRRMKDE